MPEVELFASDINRSWTLNIWACRADIAQIDVATPTDPHNFHQFHSNWLKMNNKRSFGICIQVIDALGSYATAPCPLWCHSSSKHKKCSLNEMSAIARHGKWNIVSSIIFIHSCSFTSRRTWNIRINVKFFNFFVDPMTLISLLLSVRHSQSQAKQAWCSSNKNVCR